MGALAADIERRHRFEAVARQQVEHPGAEGLGVKRRLADREEVIGIAERAVLEFHPRRRVDQQHGMRRPVENGVVHRPQPVRGAVHGLAIAERMRVMGLTRLELADIAILRAMRDEVSCFDDVADELPARPGQVVIDQCVGAAGEAALEQRLERRQCLGPRHRWAGEEGRRLFWHGELPVRSGGTLASRQWHATAPVGGCV
jgi:hypothetical protein